MDTGGEGLPPGNTGQRATASLAGLAFVATDILQLTDSKSP
jgi:hypothetical protein